MITMIVDTLPVFYYEKRVDYTPSSFDDLVFIDERIEVGLRRGKFDYTTLMNFGDGRLGEKGEYKEEGTHVVTVVPTWSNFPPAQQCQYSGNISPSHYPPSYYPRIIPATHPIPNTTPNTNQNTNQGRNFPKNKHVEFPLIPMPYVDLLPYYSIMQWRL